MGGREGGREGRERGREIRERTHRKEGETETIKQNQREGKVGEIKGKFNETMYIHTFKTAAFGSTFPEADK